MDQKYQRKVLEIASDSDMDIKTKESNEDICWSNGSERSAWFRGFIGQSVGNKRSEPSVYQEYQKAIVNRRDIRTIEGNKRRLLEGSLYCITGYRNEEPLYVSAASLSICVTQKQLYCH